MSPLAGSNPAPSASARSLRLSPTSAPEHWKACRCSDDQLPRLDCWVSDEQSRLRADGSRLGAARPAMGAQRQTGRRHRAEQLRRATAGRGSGRGDAHVAQAVEGALPGEDARRHGLHGGPEAGRPPQALPLRRCLHAASAVRAAHRDRRRPAGRGPGRLRRAVRARPSVGYDACADHPRLRQVLHVLHHPLPPGPGGLAIHRGAGGGVPDADGARRARGDAAGAERRLLRA